MRVGLVGGDVEMRDLCSAVPHELFSATLYDFTQNVDSRFQGSSDKKSAENAASKGSPKFMFMRSQVILIYLSSP